MIEAWNIWLVIVGLAIGVAVTFVLLVRLPRAEDDVSVDERRAEAAWIAATIERRGGVAPVPLVGEVLELHQAYLRLARPPQVPRPSQPAAAMPPPGPPPPGSYPTAGPRPPLPPPGSGPPAGRPSPPSPAG